MVKMKFRMNDLESVFKDIEKTVALIWGFGGGE